MARLTVLARRLKPSDEPVVERHMWGTILRASTRPSFALHLLQWIGWSFGVALAAGSLALVARGWSDPMLLAAAVLGLGAAAPLLFFASRGSVGEIHLDRDTGEVREMVLHRIGRPTLIARHPIGDLVRTEFMAVGAKRLLLTLRFRDGHVAPVAIAPLPVLKPLIDEIETAMLSEPAPVRRPEPKRRAVPRAAAA